MKPISPLCKDEYAVKIVPSRDECTKSISVSRILF
jgi:hypothetical protein